MKTKTVKVIDVSDWDKLVQETYGRVYSFQQQDDCKSRGHEYIDVPCEPEDYENDILPEKVNHSDMGVSFKAWLTRDPNQRLEYIRGLDFNNDKLYLPKDDIEEDQFSINLWWGRNFYPHVSMIINDLHDKGLLEAGEYMIDIDW